MKKTLSIIAQALGWIALLAVVMSIGFAAENPKVMIPTYGLLFMVAVGGMLFYLSRHRRHSYDAMKTPAYVAPLCGAILLILGVIFPVFSITSFRPNVIGTGTILAFTLTLFGLGYLGVWLINCLGIKNKIFSVVGFVVLVTMALIPALAISRIDSSFGTLGVIYFTLAVTAVIEWFGFELVYRKFKPEQ